MPGYEPFLLCDFHVHTRWSDGKLSVREVVDLYGKTGKFDVIAITDHILIKQDLLARAGRIATLGQRRFGLREQDFDEYLANVNAEGQRSLKQYGMLVIPGAEVTQNRLRGRKNPHIIALDIKDYISADQSADAILREIRRQGALSIACHPHHRAPRRFEISTCYLWDHRDELSDLVDVWEAANRDDLFSVTSLSTSPMSRTAISTSRSISTRGRRWFDARKTGPRSVRPCAATSTSRSRCSATAPGPRRTSGGRQWRYAEFPLDDDDRRSAPKPRAQTRSAARRSIPSSWVNVVRPLHGPSP